MWAALCTSLSPFRDQLLDGDVSPHLSGKACERVLMFGQLCVQLCSVSLRLQGDVQQGLQNKVGGRLVSSPVLLCPMACALLTVTLTADAVVKLVNVSLSDGFTFPATTSSEPLKYLSKRLWVTSDTESSGNWMMIRLSRGEETCL